MTTSFVLGNGQSRRAIDLNQLKKHGPVYACNAIYREFTPDVLVATDRPIAEAIQNSGYSLKNRFHTRQPLPNLGALSLDKRYRGFSSGPNATALACIDGYYKIYLLGFDLGTTNGQFNNLYADTEFYKKSSSPPTFSGNWVRQLVQLAEENSNKEFIRVMGPESAMIPSFDNVKNFHLMSISEFKDLLNTSKGLL
jgi:hypothetical protein